MASEDRYCDHCQRPYRRSAETDRTEPDYYLCGDCADLAVYGEACSDCERIPTAGRRCAR